MTKQPQGKFILMAGVAFILGAIGYYFLTAPDQRNDMQKVGDAINELPNGVDKAVRQLDDRTPGDKLNDVAKDAKEDIKKSLNQQ
jgi:hypothetical protein